MIYIIIILAVGMGLIEVLFPDDYIKLSLLLPVCMMICTVSKGCTFTGN